MNNREVKGITTELFCKLEFTRRGYIVSTPISPFCRYDFIADIDGILIRIQVESSRKTKTGFQISAKSCHLTANGSQVTKYSKVDADFFCTCYNGVCYLVPIGLIEGRTVLTLSLENTWKNAHHYLDASVYEIDNQIKAIRSDGDYLVQKEFVIQQFSMQNELLAEYRSISECDLCKKDVSKIAHISECISGKRKSAYGYIWKRTPKVIGNFASI